MVLDSMQLYSTITEEYVETSDVRAHNNKPQLEQTVQVQHTC